MNQPSASDKQARLADRIARQVRHDGFNATTLDGVNLLTSVCGRAREPICYEPGLVFIIQGRKVGYLDDRVIHYGAGDYLVQAMALPFECETRVDADAPLLGASVKIPPETLEGLIADMPADVIDTTPATSDQTLPMAAVTLDDSMTEALERLVDCLDDPVSARVLGQGRIREVLFQALRGPQGHLLHRLLQDQSAYARIGQAITQLRSEFAQPLSVGNLADSVHMSASTFHAHFRRLTRLSPLQYQKRIRLLRARDLLTRRELNVSGASEAVGYQSPSQFSREYKRYFGVAPASDRQTLAEASAP